MMGRDDINLSQIIARPAAKPFVQSDT
jgi:hypothetical protein